MRVLLAYDGSPCSEAALRLAAGLRWPAPTRLTVVSVIDRADFIGAGDAAVLFATSRVTEQEAAAAAQSGLDDAAATLRGPGRTVETRLEHGRPGATIVRLAEGQATDLIIVGSRGLGAWSALLLGSVSTEVVDHAPCPVLVARHDRVERLLVATDGSESATRAVDTVAGWRLFSGMPADVLAVNVVRPAADWAVAVAAGWIEEQSDEFAQVASDQQQFAAQAAERLRSGGISATAEVRSGDAAEEIVAAARVDGDLVVLGSRGLGRFSRLLLGSVARKVLLHTAASVLIVREPHATQAAAAPVGALAASAP
ncbi:MAG TPA: universal stress protein [Candidatus Limnocylindria bacterium]|nr:universal stress protein [Candidatus Limnocylindria bacterium]